MSGVSFQSIDKVYPGFNGEAGSHAVKHLDLEIEEGGLVTLLGPSGCGKTTTLRMLAGFETPTSGKILLQGRDVTNTPVNRRGIGMVFQSYALFPHMSVRDNVAFGLKVAGEEKGDIGRRVDSVLELMHLAKYADRAPSQLSGGQQQRVALARAVVTEPKVLLFDEPLSNLDAQLRERMRDELRALQQRMGITSLYVTHDQSEAMAISDRVVVMRDGVIEQDDTPSNIYARPKTAFVAEFMGRANILFRPVSHVADGAAVVEIGGSPLSLPLNGITVAPQDEVGCVLRPEQILIDPEGSVATRVERVVYQGAYVEYGVTVDGQACNVVDFRHHQSALAAVGDEIRLSFHQTRPWLVQK